MNKILKKTKVAAMGDLHVKETTIALYRDIFKEISEKADVLVLCGDLTDFGLANEAEILAEELSHLSIPVTGVLGNHDFQSNSHDEVKQILSKGMFVLENEPTEIEGIGFAGVKGFGGGFDNYSLGSWGEKEIKDFVQEAINEALTLEMQLQKLETEKKVVVLHYSPIRGTVIGEPEEIFPFLGSSRLVNPINWFGASAVFHGHAHHGTYEGQTQSNIPVYNCSINVVKKAFNDRPYALVEL
jgi:Icc-related predicted phosphoesterase